jgi:hypothetical protein
MIKLVPSLPYLDNNSHEQDNILFVLIALKLLNYPLYNNKIIRLIMIKYNQYVLEQSHKLLTDK